MNMKDKKILNEIAKDRNLQKATKSLYQLTIKEYTDYNNKPLHELINEAETEEENGKRWKHRTLKKRLINFRNHLIETHNYGTALNRFRRIKAIYRHYDIEIHELPQINRKNINKNPPISFKDLPDKEVIKQALKIGNPLMNAIILFISSSGCGRTETLNLTVKDFLYATWEYHETEDIPQALNTLKKHGEVIPTFQLKRQKTNKYYVTFCSPEAVNSIISYLLTRPNLKKEDSLFKIGKTYLIITFGKINDTLDLGKKGTYNRFRSHMLRKYHASQLYNDGMSLEDVDSLQGRGRDSTHSAYFMDDPEKLKEKYIQHMNAITINMDVNNLDIKSPDYIKLENKYHEEQKTNKENRERLDILEASLKDRGLLRKI